jgi:hypothetical protein
VPEYKVIYEIVGKNRTRRGECVGSYSEADAEALAAIWGDSLNSGLPVGRIRIVGLEMLETIAREVRNDTQRTGADVY